jgi:aspartyl-tRNA(Asn)/glutamyl-tRNA(Gln) amidotransferase subunit C
MTKLEKQEILKLARLARLTLSNDEVELFQKELSAIFGYFDDLLKADIERLEPTYQVSGLVNQYREDSVVSYQATPDQLLAIAPATEDRFLKVRKIL